ncbi:MAG: hypothetical protein MR270_03535 [Erysipelotrichaceae bacterium]|nr:hypothetical protein [Erysipelotrichaceae bacterium]
MNLHQFFLDNKFRVDKKITYGIYRNRMLNFTNSFSYVKVTISFNGQIGQTVAQNIIGKVREIKEQNRLLQHGVATNAYLLLLFYKSSDFDEHFFKILDNCIDILDANNIDTCEVCPFCKQSLPSSSPFIRMNNIILQGHDGCIAQMIMQSNALVRSLSKPNKTNTKNVLLNFALAMLSMIIITILTIAFSYIHIFSFISLLSGISCYFLSKFLIKKVKANTGLLSLIVSFVFSIICIMISSYIGSSINLVINNKTLQLIDVLTNFIKICDLYFNDFTVFLLVDIALSIAFCIFNFVIDVKKGTSSQRNIYKIDY